jgi:transcriptional regulator with XRE-family HTH domain
MYLNLKVSIWQSGLRQNRLAQALNMDEALLSRIINGFREPTAAQRTNIAQALRKDETWLFARDGDTPSDEPTDFAARSASPEPNAEPNPA